jgi:hypothetical protein
MHGGEACGYCPFYTNYLKQITASELWFSNYKIEYYLLYVFAKYSVTTTGDKKKKENPI